MPTPSWRASTASPIRPMALSHLPAQSAGRSSRSTRAAQLRLTDSLAGEPALPDPNHGADAMSCLEMPLHPVPDFLSEPTRGFNDAETMQPRAPVVVPRDARNGARV